MSTLLTDLKQRDRIHDASHFDQLEKLLDQQQIHFYCGFDPTSDSLHVGSMLPLIIMKKLQNAGHTPIVVLGSATGMIGDPSGKSEERVLLSEEVISSNAAAIEQQIKLFLSDTGKNKYQILYNHDWLSKLNYIEFLRDTGKHFSVNLMIAKDSVKARLENREQGISYTEFSYMILQAYDYYWLNQNHNCRLQVGGSDQWGNITAGTDLIRRKAGEDHPQAFGLTFPLLTTASGTKFGKTERGAVWLDSKKTSAYQFYQYWLNTADEDTSRYLQLFTEIDLEELTEIEQAQSSEPQKRIAQKRLADTLTTLVHGKRATENAIKASDILFGKSFEDVEPALLLDIFADVPSTEIPRREITAGIALQDLLVKTSAAKSKGAARRLIEGGGVYLNNRRVGDFQANVGLGEFVDEQVLVIRSGKKSYFLVKVC